MNSYLLYLKIFGLLLAIFGIILLFMALNWKIVVGLFLLYWSKNIMENGNKYLGYLIWN